MIGAIRAIIPIPGAKPLSVEEADPAEKDRSPTRPTRLKLRHPLRQTSPRENRLGTCIRHENML